MDLVEAVADAMMDEISSRHDINWDATPKEIVDLAKVAIAAVKRWEMQQLEVGRDAYREKYKATMPGGK